MPNAMTSKPRGKAAAAKDKAGAGVPKPVRVGSLRRDRCVGEGWLPLPTTATAGGFLSCGTDGRPVCPSVGSGRGDGRARLCSYLNVGLWRLSARRCSLSCSGWVWHWSLRSMWTCPSSTRTPSSGTSPTLASRRGVTQKLNCKWLRASLGSVGGDGCSRSSWGVRGGPTSVDHLRCCRSCVPSLDGGRTRCVHAGLRWMPGWLVLVM